MMIVLIIFAMGLSPAIASWVISRRNYRQTQAQFALVMEAAAQRSFAGLANRLSEAQVIDGVGTIVGDISCEFNARSPYLRCAINPHGPCDACRHYQSRQLL